MGKENESKKTEWKGAGWYTVREWEPDRNDRSRPEHPEARWIERAEDLEPCEGYESVVEYYGDGIIPSELVPLDDEGHYSLRHIIDPFVGLHGADSYYNDYQDGTVADIDELIAPRDKLGYPARVKYKDWRKEYQRRYNEALADPSKQYPLSANVEECTFGQYDLFINDRNVATFDPEDDAKEIADSLVRLENCCFNRITSKRTERLTEQQMQQVAKQVNEAMGGNIDPAELFEVVHTAAIAWRLAELGA